MLRIPAFIAVLTLIATTVTGASAAQPQGGSNTKGCFNRDKCMTVCKQSGGRVCDRYCDQRAAEIGNTQACR
jgi:hypothetical protein